MSTKETPPDDLAALRERQKATRGRAWFKEFFGLLGKMPQTMRQIAVVQVFTSLGLFSIYIFLSPTIARHVFGATGPQSPSYNQGIEWAGVCFGASAVVGLVAALLLPRLVALTSRKMAHALTLICGGLGLLSIYLIQNPYLVLISMVGVGFVWASVAALPYAILSSAIPHDRMGAYMGMFSFFIAGPGIFASLAYRPIMKYFFNSNPLYVVMLGGCCFLIAAALMWRVRDPVEQKEFKAATKPALEKDALLIQERLT
ncbi:MAG: MFS transporter [Pyrinomonadaceae bacterium]|nr:MFS transporter [Pyrinomonadaceae bacterium]